MRGGGGGQGTCFISTDKLISRSGAQLFLDKRRKKELGAGGESLGQVNCKTERDFPVAANGLLFQRTYALAKPALGSLARPVIQAWRTKYRAGQWVVSCEGWGKRLRRAHLSPPRDCSPCWEEDPTPSHPQDTVTISWDPPNLAASPTLSHSCIHKDLLS